MNNRQIDKSIKDKRTANRSTIADRHLMRRTQTVTIYKSILRVYTTKKEKFYIDHSAAFGLNLTTVRAIMTQNPHLIEIDKATLDNISNRNENIEIEYIELEQDNKNIKKESSLTTSLMRLEKGEYGIGVHGIDKGSEDEKRLRADSIFNEGLDLNNNSKTILSTLISLGTNERVQKTEQEIIEYKLGNGYTGNIVIAVPLYIKNKNGEKIFLGFPDKNKKISGQQYDEHCILDRICSKMRKIPEEFVLGYYFENQNGIKSFIGNEHHYSLLEIKDRENLFNELSSNMDDISKNINELTASRNIVQLRKMKEQMQPLRINTLLIENALALILKYDGQEKFQRSRRKREILINQKDKKLPKRQKQTRKILINRRRLSSRQESNNRRTRRILINWHDVKLTTSDLSNAKGLLREGKECLKRDELLN